VSSNGSNGSIATHDDNATRRDERWFRFWFNRADAAGGLLKSLPRPPAAFATATPPERLRLALIQRRNRIAQPMK
jgi:hypothetical protein